MSNNQRRLYSIAICFAHCFFPYICTPKRSQTSSGNILDTCKHDNYSSIFSYAVVNVSDSSVSFYQKIDHYDDILWKRGSLILLQIVLYQVSYWYSSNVAPIQKYKMIGNELSHVISIKYINAWPKNCSLQKMFFPPGL